jgi:tRNA-splicing ligase RtcB
MTVEAHVQSKIPLKKIGDCRWEIPKSYKEGMRVPGLVFADEKLLPKIQSDRSLEQVANVAFLPGIVRYSLAMPDIHWGYGFPVGGVAATDPDNGGVISPGGIGFDINCGVRLVKTSLREEDVKPRLRELIQTLFSHIPCGVGESGSIRVEKSEERKMLVKGAKWSVEHGHGIAEDLNHTEANGVLEGADPDAVSDRAYQRGSNQLGTLGSGNHFLEVQKIDQVYDSEVAYQLGLELGQVTVMIHSGSRGFGYQICDDYLETTRRALTKYKISVPDIQLACAPVHSPEGKQYLAAMRCAANYAWNNRQCLMALARQVFERFFGRSFLDLGMHLIYDVAHNIAKFERYRVNGKEKLLCIHRKGATRAFPPGHPELAEDYRKIGQPVIIPGDMGRNSYLLVGTSQAMDETFGTSCHGAGRLMSRTAAVKDARGRSIEKELEEKGIIVIGRGKKGVAEEQPAAYKDVNEVVDVVHKAGIAKKVVRMRPMGVIKG